jgi:hypothetical protein
MPSQNLENLVKTGLLKQEPGDQKELDGLLRSARARLADAHNKTLSIESRFDLAYNAAHALALAALRRHGYRSDKRYTVFQCVPHTLGLGPEVWRVLTLCHERRNRAEYEGHLEMDEQLVTDLLAAADRLAAKVDALGPLK